MYLNQAHVLQKVDEYLVAKNEQPLNTQGMCKGFSTLWAHFVLREEEDIFWRYMQTLSEWNNDTITHDTTLEDFIVAIYKFQHEDFHELPGLINPSFKLGTSEVRISCNFSKVELIEFFILLMKHQLEHKICLSNKVLLIDNLKHICALIYKEENFIYYDPNFNGTIKTNSIARLVDLIHTSLADHTNNDVCPISINIHSIANEEPNIFGIINFDYIDLIELDKKFFNDRVRQFKQDCADGISDISVKNFKIWLFYTMIPSSYYYQQKMIREMGLTEYGLSEQQIMSDKSLPFCLLQTYDLEQIQKLKSWVNYSLLCDCKVFALPLELAIREEAENLSEEISKYSDEINNLSTHYNATPLMQAAFLNKPKALSLLLKHGAEINIKNNDGVTAIGFAIFGNNIKICEILLANGADPNAGWCFWPLIMTVSLKQLEMCEILLNNNANINKTNNAGYNALYFAVYNDNTAFCDLLLRHGADPNCFQQGRTVLYEAFSYDQPHHIMITRLLLEHHADPNLLTKEGNAALHIIAQRNNSKGCKLLLEYKANINIVNAKRNTALQVAILNGNYEVFSLLLNAGADLSLTDLDDNTALHIAVTKNNNAMCMDLLRLNADFNKENAARKTSLIIAIEQGNVEFIKFLKTNENDDNKLDFNVLTANNESLLHLAVREQNIDMCRVLLSFGCQCNIPNIDGITPLHIAVEKENDDLFLTLLVAGADLGLVKINKNSSLNIANNKDYFFCKMSIMYGAKVTAKLNNKIKLLKPLWPQIKPEHAELYKLLVEKKTDPTITAIASSNLLNELIEHNRVVFCNNLLSCGVDPIICDETGMAPWLKAINLGNINLIKRVFKYVKKHNFVNKEGIPLLRLALEQDNLIACEMLLKYGADPDFIDEQGNSALLVAIDHENIEFCKLLLHSGADPNIKNKDSETALYKAVWNKDSILCELLLEYKADPNITGKFDCSILSEAVGWSGIEIVKLLLKNNATFKDQNDASSTFVHVTRQLDIYKTLLRYKVIQNAMSYDGSTLLHYAAQDGNMEACKIYLKRETTKEIKNNKGETPLHYAVQTKKYDICKLLLQHGSLVSTKDNNGLTALHIAAKIGTEKIAKLLLAHKADPNTTDNTQLTPLHFAAYFGFSTLCTLLLAHGVNINAIGANNGTPLMGAYFYGYFDTYRLLLKYGASIRGINQIHKFKAEIEKHEQSVQLKPLLLARKKVVNSKNALLTPYKWFKFSPEELYEKTINNPTDKKLSRSPVQLFSDAIECGRVDLCDFLLAKQEVNPNVELIYGISLLSLTAVYGRANITELLIKAGAKDLAKLTSWTALYKAMKHNRPEVYKLLEQNLDYTYMTGAINEGDEEVCEILLSYKTNIDQSPAQKTFLKCAIDRRQEGICKILLEHGVDPNGFCWDPSPLCQAIIEEKMGIVKLLLKYKANVKAKDKYSSPVLHSLINKHLKKKSCELLLKYGVDLNEVDWQGYSALITAINSENIEICKLLLEHGADLNVKDYNSAIYKAVQLNSFKLVDLLLKYGAKTNYPVQQSNELFDLAINNKNVKLWKVLLEYRRKENPNLWKSGSCFAEAITFGSVEICKTLLEFGADVNAITEVDQPLLHLAIMYKHMAIVELFIAEGANIQIKGKNNRTALHVAAMEGAYFVGKKLIDAGAKINVLDLEGYTPLGLAVLYGHLEFCTLLLEHNAQPNRFGAHVYSPFYIANLYNHSGIIKTLLNYNAKYSLCDQTTKELPCKNEHNGNLDIYKSILSIMQAQVTRKFDKHNIDKIYKAILRVICLSFGSQSELLPLHIIAECGLEDICEMLLDFGDINEISNTLETPLYIATKNERSSMVNLFLKNAANPNLGNSDGTTPLHIAVETNNKAIVRSLLKHGADPDKKNRYNVTPRMLAEKYKAYDLLKFIPTQPPKVTVTDGPALWDSLKETATATAEVKKPAGLLRRIIGSIFDRKDGNNLALPNEVTATRNAGGISFTAPSDSMEALIKTIITASKTAVTPVAIEITGSLAEVKQLLTALSEEKNIASPIKINPAILEQFKTSAHQGDTAATDFLAKYDKYTQKIEESKAKLTTESVEDRLSVIYHPPIEIPLLPHGAEDPPTVTPALDDHIARVPSLVVTPVINASDVTVKTPWQHMLPVKPHNQ